MLTIGMVVLICVLGFWGRGEMHPILTVTPVGRTNAPDGSLKFVIAITNQTQTTRLCVAGRTKVFSLPYGSKTTNYMTQQFMQLGPKSGTNIFIDAPPQPEPWLVEVSQQRVMSKAEISARTFAFRLGLLGTNSVFPGWQRMGSFEVMQ